MSITNVSEKSKAWWLSISTDIPRLIKWFKKLQATELSARNRFNEFANEYCEQDSNEFIMFTMIAEQENKHSLLIKEFLKNEYNEQVNDNPVCNSKYWIEIKKCIKDRHTAAGAGYFAEDLSLQRMQIILQNTKQGSPIHNLFTEIIRDEEMHTRVLKKLANNYGIKETIDCHSKGLEVLKLKLSQSQSE